MKIYLRQMGGLGNQMFQYAAGLYYAGKYQADLQISADPDYRAFSYGIPRPFQLSVFRITAPVKTAGRLEMLMEAWSPRLKPAARLLRKLLNADLLAESKTFCFLPSLEVRKDATRVYMRGWWQAAAYAEAVASRLHAELVLRDAPQGQNLELLQQIAQSSASVSIHLRRGDYQQWSQGSHLLPLSYYRAAIEKVLSLTGKPVFFVFSDDIEFARQSLPQDIPRVFIDHNTVFTAYEDLRLMSACRYNIIANSSFSWWAAWLNQNPGKMVVAPRYWLCSSDSYYPDLFPSDWILLDNLS